MKNTNLIVLVFIAYSCVACAVVDSSASCAFVYDNAIKINIVKPKMEEVVGSGLRFYDLENPFLYPSGEQTKVVFSPLLIDGWRQATQEISYVFHFDSCTSDLLDFYKREYN